MTHDRSYKILLSAITMLLCANLLIALRARPGQAQHARGNRSHYQVIEVAGMDTAVDIDRKMNTKANDGYRFKGMGTQQTSLWIVMEK
jgi:hypothetical protein